MSESYLDFIEKKSHMGGMSGFDPVWMPGFLFDFQVALTEWAIRKGRAAIYADCGLGKTPMLLVFAENVVRKTGGKVLIVCPLAVAPQTVREGEKFGIECARSSDGTAKGNITVTNYERLHLFDASDFVGIVADESSAIKDFKGVRQSIVNDFARKLPYRLLCTATAAPNDYIELLTSAEILGEMGRMDALGTFFKNDENSLHPIWWGARWRFKKHAEKSFWRWVCSWSRALRKPSDMGFDDGKFHLPPLHTCETVVGCSVPRDGEIMVMPAVTLKEQQGERKTTIRERCEVVAEKCAPHDRSLVWCHYNNEANLLVKMMPGAKQICGSDSDEYKERTFLDFAENRLERLIIKPRIGAFGLNLQNCAHMTFFPSHSFEQWYQGIRRCWRFGQTRPVHVDMITTEGEIGVLKNLQRKSEQAEKMFTMLVANMNDALRLDRSSKYSGTMTIPDWMK